MQPHMPDMAIVPLGPNVCAEVNPLTRIRASLLGRLYLLHLRQYRPVRALALYTWRIAFPVYQHAYSMLKRKSTPWLPIISFTETTKHTRLGNETLIPEQLINSSYARVVAPYGDKTPFIDSGIFKMPALQVATIENATQYGGTNLVFTQQSCLRHDFLDVSRESTSEELHGRALFNRAGHKIKWLALDKYPSSIGIAASFVDACAANYAHWLSEVLPRIAAFCSNARFKDIPIIVNSDLHANILSSLHLIAGNRTIYGLRLGHSVAIEKLHLVSVAGYVPFGYRKKGCSHHGRFNAEALRGMKTTILQKINCSDEPFPKRIFLRRSSNARQLSNTSQIETYLDGLGFTAIEPEKLSFQQQVLLFNNADVVIGATGAALANCIFCKSGAKVCILMGQHQNMIYGYWANMLSPLDIKTYLVLGGKIPHSPFGIHGNFSVAEDDLKKIIEDIH